MSDIRVLPLLSGWNVHREQYSLSGVRTYIEDLNDDPAAIDLPPIGSAWDDADYANLILVSQDIGYMADFYKDDDNRCARKFTCSYSGTTFIQTPSPFTPDDLPISISTAAQITSFEPNPKDNIWKWWSDGEKVNQLVGKREVITNISFNRVIKDLAAYNALVQAKTGLLNDKVFKGYPIGCVIFDGCDYDEYRNSWGAKRWKITIKFTARRVTFDSTYIPHQIRDGWCFILRDSTGKWELPFYNTGTTPPYGFAYEFTDFDPLFTTAPLGDDESVIIPPPTR